MHTTAFPPMPFHRSLLAIAAFGLAIATLAGAHATWADATSDLFDFRDRAAAHAKDHPSAERFKVICAKTVALGGARPTISFAGLPGTGAQLAIFTERPFRDVSRAIWLEPHIV